MNLAAYSCMCTAPVCLASGWCPEGFADSMMVYCCRSGKDEKEENSVLLDHIGSIHRTPLDFRRLFSGSRRVNDRRSNEAAAASAASVSESEAASTVPKLAIRVDSAQEDDPARRISLHRAQTPALSTLAEQLSSLSHAEMPDEELAVSRAPSRRQTHVPGDITPLTLSPARPLLSGHASMTPLMLSPSRKEMSALPVAHESVQIGRPGSADALKEVHAEIMDKGVQMPPSRRASLSRHNSELGSRHSTAASPIAALAARAAEDRPLTLAHSWARIAALRPPSAGRSANAACSALPGSDAPNLLGQPSAQPGQPGQPRPPLQAWSSLPSLAPQLPPPSQKSLQLPAAVLLAKQITPSSPEWVPSPFGGTDFQGRLSALPAQPSERPAAEELSMPRTPRASPRAELLQHASMEADGSAQHPSAHRRLSVNRGILRHSSARADMLQRAANALSRRNTNQEDIQSILQVSMNVASVG